jgi:CheY-like chemotaxis protein
VCFSILERHGGSIEVESEVGKGTEFRFFVPASDEVLSVSEDRTGEVPGGEGRVLVLDDEESLREMATDMLENLGYSPTAVADGASAVSAYRQAKAEGEPYRLVILDLTIPGGMGGKEVMELLLKEFPDVRAIVSSGYSHDPVMAKYSAHGFAAAVAKPYSYPEFARTVHEALWRTRNS